MILKTKSTSMFIDDILNFLFKFYKLELQNCSNINNHIHLFNARTEKAHQRDVGKTSTKKLILVIQSSKSLTIIAQLFISDLLGSPGCIQYQQLSFLHSCCSKKVFGEVSRGFKFDEMFKVNNGNNRTRCEILLLTLNIFHTLFQCFYC